MKARAGLRACGLIHIQPAKRTNTTPIYCSQCLYADINAVLPRPTVIGGIRRNYRPSRRRSQPQSSLASAVSSAQNMISKSLSKPPPATARDSTRPGISVDPLRLVGQELKFLKKNIRQLLGSGHPLLDRAAKYYARSEGKQVRPMLVLLMSQATALSPRDPHVHERGPFLSGSTVNEPLSSSSVLNDVNPDTDPLTSIPDETAYSDVAAGAGAGAGEESNSGGDTHILPSQRRLAEITELIHTASLLHDDVIDNAVTRRSTVSANLEFGNKMAVLAGDFLLGRASVGLARLRDAEVTELLSTVIANLIEGEFMQLKNTAQDEKYPSFTDDTISYYLQKTYLKSASLISKSCRAAALLGQTAPEIVDAAYQYGKNLGLAFQLVDDMLDYTITGQELGKPAGADLELGLATAPLLFAWKQHPELGPLVGRKFGQEGDVQLARQIVSQSNGLEQTRALAQEYADNAIQAISILPDSEAKSGLIETCVKTMSRRK